MDLGCPSPPRLLPSRLVPNTASWSETTDRLSWGDRHAAEHVTRHLEAGHARRELTSVSWWAPRGHARWGQNRWRVTGTRGRGMQGTRGDCPLCESWKKGKHAQDSAQNPERLDEEPAGRRPPEGSPGVRGSAAPTAAEPARGKKALRPRCLRKPAGSAGPMAAQSQCEGLGTLLLKPATLPTLGRQARPPHATTLSCR